MESFEEEIQQATVKSTLIKSSINSLIEDSKTATNDKRGISRREFFKLTFGAAASLAIPSILAGCDNENTETSAIEPNTPEPITPISTGLETIEKDDLLISYNEEICGPDSPRSAEDPNQELIEMINDTIGVYTITPTSNPNKKLNIRVTAKNQYAGLPEDNINNRAMPAKWHEEEDITKPFLAEKFRDEIVTPLARTSFLIDKLTGTEPCDIFIQKWPDIYEKLYIGDSKRIVSKQSETGYKMGIIIQPPEIQNYYPEIDSEIAKYIYVIAHEKLHTKFEAEGLKLPMDEATTEAITLALLPGILDNLELEDITPKIWEQRAMQFAEILLSHDNQNYQTPYAQSLQIENSAGTYPYAFVPYSIIALTGAFDNPDQKDIKTLFDKLTTSYQRTDAINPSTKSNAIPTDIFTDWMNYMAQKNNKESINIQKTLETILPSLLNENAEESDNNKLNECLQHYRNQIQILIKQQKTFPILQEGIESNNQILETSFLPGQFVLLPLSGNEYVASSSDTKSSGPFFAPDIKIAFVQGNNLIKPDENGLIKTDKQNGQLFLFGFSSPENQNEHSIYLEKK